jgi:hypothetical protein
MEPFKVEVIPDNRGGGIVRLHILEMNFDLLSGKHFPVLERMAAELRSNITGAVAIAARNKVA